jgi:hypothetical protein
VFKEPTRVEERKEERRAERTRIMRGDNKNNGNVVRPPGHLQLLTAVTTAPSHHHTHANTNGHNATITTLLGEHWHHCCDSTQKIMIKVEGEKSMRKWWGD